jgi:peptidase E
MTGSSIEQPATVDPVRAAHVAESSMAPRILAIGGGGFLMEDAPSPIDRYIAQSTGRETPKVCFISTPSGDSVEMIDKFYAAFEALGCAAAHLAFFRRPFRASLPLAGFAAPLLDQDAIFVGGGNTKSALAVWREWGLDQVLNEAWRRGILLAGMSAGAICWFEEGLTDSYWGAGLKPLQCMGLLPGGCCVHYSSEPERRVRLHAEVAGGISGPRVAIDDGAAVLYSNGKIQEVVSWRPGATAYQVVAMHGKVVEQAHTARTIA